jgi:two-component system response regulator YesN
VYSILIVDDERIIREGIAKLMPWDQLKIDKVLQASNGRQALTLAGKMRPDIILTDKCMPDMDGLEFIRDLLDLGLKADGIRYEPRILILTGHDRFDYAQQSCKLGAKDLLLKPVDEAVLVQVLTRQVEAIDRLRDEQLQQKQLEQQLERQVATAKILRLEQIIRRAIQQDLVTQEEKNWLSSNEPRLLGSFRIGLFNVEGLSIMPDDDRELVRFGLLQLSRQILDASHLGISLSLCLSAETALVCWLFAEDDNNLIGTCDQLCTLANREYGMSVKVGLSHPSQSIQESNACWQEAQVALKSGQAVGSHVYLIDDKTRPNLMLRNVYTLKRKRLDNLSEEWQLQDDILELTDLLSKLNEPADWIRKECGELALKFHWRQLSQRHLATDADNQESFDHFLHDLASLDPCQACKRLNCYIQESMLCSETTECIHPIVQQAVQFIKSHLREDLSVAGLAEILHVSPNYLSRIFRQAVGEGCNEYIIRKRMELAQSLLTQTNLRTYEIAEQVGYQDKNYFSLTFRKFVGQSPTDYRKNNQIF